MKTLLNSALPALALLALGGCATTGAISSTETDDVYYSSKDRTTYAAPAAGTGYQSSGYQPNGYGSASTQTQAPAGEDANPDYQGGTAQTGTGTDYYDDSYNSVQPSGFGQPYTGPGVSTYNYTPSWSVAPMAYASPWGYGTGLSMGYGYGGFGGYSPFSYGYGYPAYAGFYDPFYSPFYSPFGYGSGLSIGFGYGFGGFGGYPYYGGGFGSPYRYGYGYPGYAYGGGYGGGYYGGDYGYGRGGARNYVYKQGIMNGSYSNGYDPGAIKVGRRGSRYADAVGSGGMVAPGGGGMAVPAGATSNRRMAAGAASGFDRAVAPGGGNAPALNGMTNGQPATVTNGRRFEQNTVNANSPGGANGAYSQPRVDAANAGAGQPQRRGGFFREVFANPNPGQAQSQNNGYSQPRRQYDQQRAFSQPQQQQRSFDQQRSFSQPRMEQRSFTPAPAPSFGGGGGGGGGSFGGGGGGGGRRGR